MNRELNGYIMSDGEYVRLADLEGMERSLRHLFGGDLVKVVMACARYRWNLPRSQTTLAVGVSSLGRKK